MISVSWIETFILIIRGVIIEMNPMKLFYDIFDK